MAWTSVLAHIEEEVERSMLIGNEVLGINPLRSHNTKYRENFREHLATLDARQKDVPKDLRENWLYAMSTLDILNPINDVIHKHGLPKEALDGLGEHKLQQVIDDMPTRRVDLHLHKQVLRNPSYLARSTDLEDWRPPRRPCPGRAQLPTDRVATRPVTSAAYASAISVRCRGGRES